MGYKNPKEFLVAATQLPRKIEEKLPENAPKISTKLVDATNKMPDFPDFPMELPDLPPIPELPEKPGGQGLKKRYVTNVEVVPIQTDSRLIVESPHTGVLPEVITRRGM